MGIELVKDMDELDKAKFVNYPYQVIVGFHKDKIVTFYGRVDNEEEMLKKIPQNVLFTVESLDNESMCVNIADLSNKVVTKSSSILFIPVSIMANDRVTEAVKVAESRFEDSWEEVYDYFSNFI